MICCYYACGCKCLIRLAVRQYVGTGTNVVASCNVHANALVSKYCVLSVCDCAGHLIHFDQWL